MVKKNLYDINNNSAVQSFHGIQNDCHKCLNKSNDAKTKVNEQLKFFFIR